MQQPFRRRDFRPRVRVPSRHRALILGAVVFLSLAAPARAGDGVIEINASRAAAGGITSGDGAGFPVSINEPGSYRLTGNLRLSTSAASVSTHMIVVAADDVTLDLNGFTVSCTRNTLPASFCSSGGGTGRGIEVTGDNVRILNGTIRGMAGNGIRAADSASYVVEGMRVLDNGDVGLEALNSSLGRVARSTFRGNEGSGMRFGTGSRVTVLEVATENNLVGIIGVVIAPAPDIALGHSVLVDGRSGTGFEVVACFVDGTTRICP
jgi:hypothetical protein